MKIFFSMLAVVIGLVCICIGIFQFYVDVPVFLFGCLLVVIGGGILIADAERRWGIDQEFRDYLERGKRR